MDQPSTQEEHPMTIEIADRLTALRRERGMSQEELAEKLHVSR